MQCCTVSAQSYTPDTPSRSTVQRYDVSATQDCQRPVKKFLFQRKSVWKKQCSWQFRDVITDDAPLPSDGSMNRCYKQWTSVILCSPDTCGLRFAVRKLFTRHLKVRLDLKPWIWSRRSWILRILRQIMSWRHIPLMTYICRKPIVLFLGVL